MNDHTPPETEALAASLEPYSKQELADMMAHVIKTYVVDGTTPNRPELGIIDFPKHLRDLNFPQLISQLKMHLDLPELNLFSVASGEVLVNLGGREYSLTDPHARPPAPAPAPSAAAPGAQASPAAPSSPEPAEQPPAEPENVEVSERFRMLELD